jgi:hypothetical protein
MCDGHPEHNHREQTNTQAQTTKTSNEPKFVVEVEETSVPECVETPATR